MLSRSLRGLIQVCSLYLTSLARTLGLPPPPETVSHLALTDSRRSLLDCPETGLPPLTDTVSTHQPVCINRNSKFELYLYILKVDLLAMISFVL